VCLKLNKLVEAERALLTDKYFSKNILSKEVEGIIPNGAAGYYLLGLITEKLGVYFFNFKNRSVDAISAYKKALDMDPFMWCAYEKLCKLSPSKIDPSKIFSDLNAKILKFKKGLTNPITKETYNSVLPKNFIMTNNQPSTNQPKDFSLSPMNVFNNKFNSTENKNLNPNKFNQTNMNWIFDENEMQRQRQGNPEQPLQNTNMTPVLNKDKPDDYQNMNYNQPLVKNRDNLKPFTYSSSPHGMILEFNKSSEVQKNNNNFTNSNSNEMKIKYGDSSIKPFNISNTSGQVLNNEFTPKNFMPISNKPIIEENQPFNKNMFNNIQLNEKESVFTPTGENTNMGNKIFSSKVTKNFENSNIIKNYSGQSDGLSDITQLLKIYSEIAKNFFSYNCDHTISLIKELPLSHQKSRWILIILARSYFELTKYKESDKVFKECLQRYPANLEGMDFYSSCLWHLKDQFNLVNLANSCLEQSHYAPETWIVVGNCHSLQKEHELALKFFNRAIQISPQCAYAYTLSGHENVATENFHLAKQCYNSAINCDDR
jgi:anaphase-promoting complex subunit 3